MQNARYGLPPDRIPAELDTSYAKDHARSYPIDVKSAVQDSMLDVWHPNKCLVLSGTLEIR